MPRLTMLKPRVGALRPTMATLAPDSWRTSDMTSADRGYDARWRKARLLYLRRHPLCVYCQREDRATLATVVDHIIPHRGDQQRFWDEDNWQSLCNPCHVTIKARIERNENL